MSEISPHDLNARLDSDADSVVVLDIRPTDVFENWNIPESTNMDIYEDLKNGAEAAEEALATLPNEKEIITVCAAGSVSQTATEVLEELGYEARTLTDGMNGWSRVHRHAPIDVGLGGQLVQVARPGKGCLSHVLVSGGKAAVFDPSHYAEEYEALFDEHEAELVGVFDTHAHADHVSGGQLLAGRHDVPYHLHRADATDVDATALEDGQSFTIGDVEVGVVHTPGHSPGSVTYAVEGKALLTGDTLFHESVGRVELGVEAGLEETGVEDNAATLYESLQRLLETDDDPLVLPAHDPGSPSPPVTARLSEVRERNSDLGRNRAEFVEALSSDTPEHPPNFQRVKRFNVGSADIPTEELAKLELGPNRCAAE